MAYKQEEFLKIIIIIPILFFSFSVFGQKYVPMLLRQGDSLYNARQYVQSLKCYREISREGQNTSAMWLKMAYIHEGLGQISETMYCLEKYKKLTMDGNVQEKILLLANRHNLSGYEPSKDYWEGAWQKFLPWIASFLMAIVVLLFVLFVRETKKGSPSIDAVAAMVITMILLIAVTLRAEPYRLGILNASSPTYLMNAPSSGANVVAQVPDGHRVRIIGEYDVWLKVFWEKQELYIRKTAIRSI